MTILIISAKNKTVFNFRGDLIKDMIAKGNNVYVTGPNKEYIDDIMALGVKDFIEVPSIKDNTSIKNDLRYLSLLKKVIKKLHPDIVFSYNIKPVIYGSIAARAEGVPHIFSMVTGLGRVYAKNGFKTKIIRLITNCLYKTAFKGCEKVIFQNGDDVDELVNSGILSRQKACVVNGSGVNMERFTKTNIPEKPVFLMVSRIIREKGVLEYCAAAREIRKKNPEATCILLGGFDSSIGALRKDDIQEYIDDGSIVFPGEVKDPVSFYSKASVFVLPSYYREGLPRTILEAMACGKPIITTDWTGCREAVIDGRNGFLIPIRNTTLLVQKMLMLCDCELAQNYGEMSYCLCKEKYRVEIVNQQMREIIGY